MLNIGKIKDGDLLLYGEINEREPSITDGLVSSFNFDGTTQKYVPNLIRYVRDWSNGNTVNAFNNWTEIRMIDQNDVNLALNKKVTSNKKVRDNFTLSSVVNGSLANNDYVAFSNDETGPAYVQVDLGEIYNIKEIKIWRWMLDGRTYHDTKTEVSQDGVDWYTIFDSKIEGEYPESADGKEINLSELGLSCKPSIDENTILNYKGITIQNGTSNIIPSNKMKFSQWDIVGSANVVFNENQFTQEWLSSDATRIMTAGGINFAKLSLDVAIPTVNTLHYTSQVKIKNIGFNPVIFSDNINTPITVEVGEVKTVILHCVGDGTSNLKLQFLSKQISDSLDFIVFEPQVENKIYASAFVNSTRQSGELEMLFKLAPPFSLTFKHTGIQKLSTISDLNPVTVMQIGKTHGNRNTISLINDGNLNLLSKGNSSDDWSISKNNILTYTSDNWDRVEHHYTIVCLEDKMTVKIYLDGKLLTAVSGTDPLSAIDEGVISLGISNVVNANYRDMFIYNRVLTDNEIKLIANGGFDLSSDGDLTMREVIEGIIIPKNSTLFPLSSSTTDSNGIFEAKFENNVSYYNNSAWVGTATENLLYKTGAVNLEDAVDIKGNSTKTDLGFGYYQFKNNGNGPSSIKLSCNLGDLESGKSYSAQVCFIENYGTVSLSYNGSNLSPKKTSRMGKIYGKFVKSSYDSSNNFVCVELKPNTSVILHNEQVEEGIFISPFTESVRNNSSLKFNLYKDLGLIWSGSWSISYWKKPVATNTDDFIGYNIDSLGCENNTVGGGYAFWGKTQNQDVLKAKISAKSNDPFNFTPSKFNSKAYFDNWHMVSIVKDSSRIKITEWSIGGQDHSFTIDIGNVNPNHFVTQGGYDLQLGGWEDAVGVNSPVNAYYRDLVVAKRAFTDRELSEMLRRQFVVERDIFRVQRTFREGVL